MLREWCAAAHHHNNNRRVFVSRRGPAAEKRTLGPPLDGANGVCPRFRRPIQFSRPSRRLHKTSGRPDGHNSQCHGALTCCRLHGARMARRRNMATPNADSGRESFQSRLLSPLPVPVATGDNTTVATNVSRSICPPTPGPPGPHSVISVRTCTSRRHLYCGAPDSLQQQQRQQSAACPWYSPQSETEIMAAETCPCAQCVRCTYQWVCVCDS